MPLLIISCYQRTRAPGSSHHHHHPAAASPATTAPLMHAAACCQKRGHLVHGHAAVDGDRLQRSEKSIKKRCTVSRAFTALRWRSNLSHAHTIANTRCVPLRGARLAGDVGARRVKGEELDEAGNLVGGPVAVCKGSAVAAHSLSGLRCFLRSDKPRHAYARAARGLYVL